MVKQKCIYHKLVITLSDNIFTHLLKLSDWKQLLAPAFLCAFLLYQSIIENKSTYDWSPNKLFFKHSPHIFPLHLVSSHARYIKRHFTGPSESSEIRDNDSLLVEHWLTLFDYEKSASQRPLTVLGTSVVQQ